MKLHKYLPRLTASVLAGATAAACGDPAAPVPEPLPRLVLDAVLPAGDSVPQLGVEVGLALRDTVRLFDVRVYADSAADPTVRERVDLAGLYGGRTSWRMLVVAPGSGRHTLTVAVTDANGQIASASFTRTFVLPDVPYTAVALPDLGGGANALHVNAAGDAAGWVAAPGGPQQPAVWKAGALTVLPLPGGATSAAVRQFNAAGDALLQLRNADVNAFSASVAVRRADGALIRVGPVRYTTPATGTIPAVRALCCSVAGALNDQRVALGTGYPSSGADASARYDVATGALVDTLPAAYSLLNNAGQMVGARQSGPGLYPSTYVIAAGFTVPSLPPGPSFKRCDPAATRFTRTEPVALDDSANVLVNHECGSFAYLSAAGSVWLDRAVGRSVAARMAPRGGLVATLDGAGTVYLWRAAAGRASRVRLTGGAWRVDSLGWVNAAGVVAAHGVDASGRGAALLLAPATR